MKIELKNIHYSAQLSEETNAFSAALYIDGFKAGVVANHGRGGSTDYRATTQKGKELLAQAEIYCGTLPPFTYSYEGKENRIAMDLEMYLEQIVDDHVKGKELQKFRKKIERASVQGIVFGTPDESFRSLRCRVPLASILAHPSAGKTLISLINNNVLPLLEAGQMVLNTNIPEEVLKETRLKENQYVKQILPEKKLQKAAKKKGRKL